ncbi:MAG: alpha/beta fold hydrolase [Prosthecobacter sp.]|uniref:alpha/beta fold hydrolase n=1 Tax=Prosthecobacter sp. TaxID=1965333 RepID=UPI001A05BC02|nr:alpha/beta fold hydrolase [Prosthecobacter sp.]MBE2284113.1 alpha/beta fold hydrolase [Prosthecobacter sp.]
MEPIPYHIIHQGQQAGPFTMEQLQQMLAAGQVTPDHMVWKPGLAEWQPLKRFLPPPLPPIPSVPARPAMPAQAPVLTVPVAAKPKKKSMAWLWVTLALLFMIVGIGVVAAFLVKDVMKEGTDELAFRPLFEERQNHFPQWRESSFEAAGPADVPDGKIFELIRYQSPGGKMAAYLTPDPKDGQRHPAIVWAHGGFGGIGSYFWEPAGKRNDQSARAFREKGIVMMCPSWRGENDNPGRFELFYNELRDFLSAIDHVKRLPYVDPQRVYIGGHSTGGTMTLLAAVSSDQFRAAFSFGGMIDGVQTLGDGEGYGNTPYDPNSNIDHRLRSPMRYASFIRRPTFYFEGGEYYDEGSAGLMQLRALTHFESFHLPGDHFDILHPITHLIAEKIIQDTGAQCNIRFTESELRQRYNAAFATSLATELNRWSQHGGSLAEALKKADPDDAVPRTETDMIALNRAAEQIVKKNDLSAGAAASIATLAAMRDEIEDEKLIGYFDTFAMKPLVVWAQARLKHPGPFSKEEAESYFETLAALATCEKVEAADLVISAVRSGRLPDTYQWNSVFRTYDEEHPHTEHLMATFAENPPVTFAGVLLLDSVNQLFLDDWDGTNPFNSPQGVAALKNWLESRNPDYYSHAHSAALGTAFIDEKLRAEVLPLALQHPDLAVRMEGAWADVKNGGSQGLTLLKQTCLELHQSDRAQGYLKELKHEQDIPPEALEPAFAAQAVMSRWLQHPNELGDVPKSIEIFDHKKLFWPPAGEEREMWLIKFTYQFKDDAAPKTGYGCVGSMTWSSFEEYPTPPKPEELYLHHCALEMERDEKRSEQAAKAEDANARALNALKKGNPGVFDSLAVPPKP